MNLTPIIKDSFTQYSGAVLQSRALPDVRDMLKPSARQIFYCLYTDKFTYNKPFKKTLKAIGSAMRMYIHGDSSCEGIIMRASQDFAMRYPFVEVEGSNGDPVLSGNWSAPRYTSSRLSQLANYLFEDIEKNTINEWRDNYDDTEQYPAILPTKGFYGIVNGGMGIGVGAAFSCPQFNIKDVNTALEKLLDNPNIDFEEIYCAPDFASGAILLNESEVKESLKKGVGSACKLRSVVSFDSDERCLIATEIPYGVYTNTICGELDKILESEDNPGVDRYNDLTKGTPIIKIYLKRAANPDKVLRYLYKNTSLQSHFGINLTMLENGRFPKVFSWKDALQAHIDHEKVVYRRGYEFDLAKIEKRLHIIEGLLICVANITEVVQTIKSSASTAAASKALQENFLLDAEQAKAVLDMKLSRLANLEVEKLKNEKEELEKQADEIRSILSNESLFNQQLINGWREVTNKFGDARRTKILNIESENEEPKEIKTLQISLTNKNNVIVNETSSLYTQKRGGVGNKAKLEKQEYIYLTKTFQTNDKVLFFTNFGNFYSCDAETLPYNDTSAIEAILNLKDGEYVCELTSLTNNKNDFIYFFTKNGFLKKSSILDYNVKRSGAIRAITLEDNDEIVNVFIGNFNAVAAATKNGRIILTKIDDVKAIGRVGKGIKLIKLDEKDSMCAAKPILNGDKWLISVTEKGLIKRNELENFAFTGRNTKGVKLHKLIEDSLADFCMKSDITESIICSNCAQIKISDNEIPNLSKDAAGVKSIKTKENEKIIKILAC